MVLILENNYVEGYETDFGYNSNYDSKSHMHIFDKLPCFPFLIYLLFIRIC